MTGSAIKQYIKYPFKRSRFSDRIIDPTGRKCCACHSVADTRLAGSLSCAIHRLNSERPGQFDLTRTASIESAMNVAGRRFPEWLKFKIDLLVATPGKLDRQNRRRGIVAELRKAVFSDDEIADVLERIRVAVSTEESRWQR